MPDLTIAEKIISKNIGHTARAGEYYLVDVDFVFGHDGSAPMAIQIMEKNSIKNIFNPKKIALIIDHNSPAPNSNVANLHKIMYLFSRKHKCRFLNAGDGICHQLIIENGYALPGSIVIGSDSHSCTYGAFNVFSTGVGSTDLAAIMATGKIWLRVPETIKIHVFGKLKKGVYSKDLILYIIKKLRANGGNYKAIEFFGEAISSLSMDARFTVCNMAVNIGAKTGLMKIDQKSIDWAKENNIHINDPIYPDEKAQYCKTLEIDAGQLEPQIAKPHTVDNVSPITEIEGTHIDLAFIGTCANGMFEDLEVAALMLKEKKVKKGVRLIISPASKNIYLKALNSGIIKTIVEAGAMVLPPGCGPCTGSHLGIPADNENVISSGNKNFIGRMGNSKASIYLASPASVALAAIKGHISNPRKEEIYEK